MAGDALRALIEERDPRVQVVVPGDRQTGALQDRADLQPIRPQDHQAGVGRGRRGRLRPRTPVQLVQRRSGSGRDQRTGGDGPQDQGVHGGHRVTRPVGEQHRHGARTRRADPDPQRTSAGRQQGHPGDRERQQQAVRAGLGFSRSQIDGAARG